MVASGNRRYVHDFDFLGQGNHENTRSLELEELNGMSLLILYSFYLFRKED